MLFRSVPVYRFKGRLQGTTLRQLPRPAKAHGSTFAGGKDLSYKAWLESVQAGYACLVGRAVYVFEDGVWSKGIVRSLHQGPSSTRGRVPADNSTHATRDMPFTVIWLEDDTDSAHTYEEIQRMLEVHPRGRSAASRSTQLPREANIRAQESARNVWRKKTATQAAVVANPDEAVPAFEVFNSTLVMDETNPNHPVHQRRRDGLVACCYCDLMWHDNAATASNGCMVRVHGTAYDAIDSHAHTKCLERARDEQRRKEEEDARKEEQEKLRQQRETEEAARKLEEARQANLKIAREKLAEKTKKAFEEGRQEGFEAQSATIQSLQKHIQDLMAEAAQGQKDAQADRKSVV